jgi:pimeloyl-ACP methyl ester carboxylesterase
MFSIEGQGTPIVVLPGFGLDRTVMSAAFEPVFSGSPTANDWRRIYLDLPGCGETPAVEPTSDAVLGAIQESITVLLGGAPFLLAGLSYGGYLAAGLARRLPDQVRGLLLVCSGVRIAAERRNLAGVLPSTPEPNWLVDVTDDLHEYFTRAIGRQTRAVGDRMSQLFEEIGPMDDDYLEELRETGYELSDEDSQQIFDGEVAVLVGRRDRVAGYQDQLGALANYSHGSFDVVADAGHYLPFERPDIFARRTLDWLARCEAVGGRASGRRAAQRPATSARPMRPERPEQQPLRPEPIQRRPARPERDERPARPERVERPARPERVERPARPERLDRTERLEPVEAQTAEEPVVPGKRPRTLRVIR